MGAPEPRLNELHGQAERWVHDENVRLGLIPDPVNEVTEGQEPVAAWAHEGLEGRPELLLELDHQPADIVAEVIDCTDKASGP